MKAPDPAEVLAIAAIENAVVRNLRITECYYRLSAAFTARTGQCANWCTFATWASRQAGRTIRGEDLMAHLAGRAGWAAMFLHPVRSFWRVVLRRGVFQPATRLGRLVRAIHSPFDVFERASDAVARGNRKVFEEIGLEFARCLQMDSEEFLRGLRAGGPPEGQDLLRQAFNHYERQRALTDAVLRAQAILLANLEIGLHEQTRLQPEIREALEAAPVTAEDLGMRALAALVPGAAGWRRAVRKPLALLLGAPARSLHRFSRDLACRAVTDALMVLDVPGGVLALGRHLDEPFADALRQPADPELCRLLERFEPAASAADDCGARDWSQLTERMHYISHLFRVYHDRAALLAAPFTPAQVEAMMAGAVPDGEL